MENRNCVICNTEFIGTKVSKICSKECRRVLSNKIASGNYEQRKSEKECKYCLDKFIGTRQQVLCEKCKGTKHNNYKTVERKVKCPQCKKVYSTVIKKGTKTKSKIILGKKCEKCKAKNKKKIIRLMKSDNNPSIKKHGRAIKKKKLTKKQVSTLLSNKMKGDKNPMKNESIKDKVSKSLIEGYSSGRIEKVTGEKHWLWKGNRERNQVIRTRLYPVWVKPILIRDNFTCQFCFTKDKELEVHHQNKSFNDVVLELLNERKIVDLNNEDFEFLISSVIKEHENVDGITCCVDCHKKIDPKRH